MECLEERRSGRNEKREEQKRGEKGQTEGLMDKRKRISRGGMDKDVMEEKGEEERMKGRKK